LRETGGLTLGPKPGAVDKSSSQSAFLVNLQTIYTCRERNERRKGAFHQKIKVKKQDERNEERKKEKRKEKKKGKKKKKKKKGRNPQKKKK